MRLCLRPLAVALTLLVSPALVHADVITVSISVIGTGMLGNVAFSDQTVTISESFSRSVLAACSAPGAPNSCRDADGGVTLIGADPTAGGQGVTESVTVTGLGTTRGGGGLAYVTQDGDHLEVGEIEGRLGFFVNDPTLTSLFLPGTYTSPFGRPDLGYQNCVNYYGNSSVCPVGLYTDAGFLTLDSAGGTAIAVVQLGSEAPVPEPGTWLLVGTGLFGAAGAVRRRSRLLSLWSS